MSGLAAFTGSRSSQCFSERSFSISLLFLFLFPSLHRRSWRRHRYSIGYVSLLSLADLAAVIVLNDFGCIVQQVSSSLFAASSPLECRAQGLYPRVWLRMYRCLFLEVLRSTLFVWVIHFDRDGVLFRRLSMSSGGW